MSQELEIVNREPGALAVSSRDRIHQAVAVIANAPNALEKVEVMERLMRLDAEAEEREIKRQDRESERDYAVALGKLQASCRNVVAAKDVDGKFRYAPFLDIWNSVRPAVEKNGFTLQWSQDHLGDRIKAILTLQHERGHKRDFNYTMRLGSNAPGTPSGAQAPVLDSQAESRAKRRLLMDCLNVVVDTVTPAEDVGDGTLATEEEWKPLRDRLLAVATDNHTEERFLKTADVQEWGQIPKSILPILRNLLRQKEQQFALKRGGA